MINVQIGLSIKEKNLTCFRYILLCLDAVLGLMSIWRVWAHLSWNCGESGCFGCSIRL